MKVAIPVVKADDDKTYWLSVEVDDDDVATFYLDDKEIFKADFENFSDLITAMRWFGATGRVRRGR